MADFYTPQPWLSPSTNPDGAQRPMSVQVNVSLPPDANSQDANLLMQSAASIINAQTTQLDRFVANQRQQQSINPLPYKAVSARMERMRARWLSNNGLERLELDVFPLGGLEAFADTSDTNLDGYMAWVHSEPDGPVGPTLSGAPGDIYPYNIYVNGYLIERDFTPALPTGGYAILFGKTAMLEPSYVGNEEKIKIEGPTKLPNKVVPPNGWGQYKAGSNGLVDQEAYNKTFGYWILDWTNHLNPCQFFDFGGGFLKQWRNLAPGSQKPPANPVFTKGMYFPNSQPKKSPLEPRGKNNFGVFLSPLSYWFGQGAELVLIDVIVGEFYDRGAYRRASQSWTVTPKPHQTIAVNDKPMLFGRGAWSGGFSAGIGDSFDLTPSVTKDFKDTNVLPSGEIGTQMGPHDHFHNIFRSYDPLVALSPEDQARYAQWVQQELQASAAYAKKITDLVKAWKDKWDSTENKKQLNRAQQMEYFYNINTDATGKLIFSYPIGTGDASGQDRVYALGQGYQPVYGPVQQYWANWDAPFDPQRPMGFGGRYVASWGQANGGTFLVFDTAPQVPDHPGPNQEWVTGSPMTRQQLYDFAKEYIKDDAIQKKNKELEAIYNTKPDPQTQGPPLGKDIGEFKYSNISISGTSWSYDQNPQG